MQNLPPYFFHGAFAPSFIWRRRPCMSMFLVSKFFVVKHTSPMKFVKVDAKIRPVVQFRKSALASGGPPNSLPALCLWTLYTGGTAVCQTTCFAVPTLDCCRRLCRRRTFRRFCKFSCSTITKYGVARKPPERCQHILSSLTSSNAHQFSRCPDICLSPPTVIRLGLCPGTDARGKC